MAFEVEELVLPLEGGAPLGAELAFEDDFARLRELATRVDRDPTAGPVDWAKELARIEALARKGRDLRVWVWLARAALAAEGLAGLVRGLELIARGLEAHWASLPPFDPDDPDPAGRYLARINAMALLGASSAHLKPAMVAELRSVRHLLDDLERHAAAGPAAELAPLVDDARRALQRIARLFREGFGAAADPQLGFEALEAALAGLAARATAAGEAEEAPAERPRAAPAAAGGPVRSREDVLRLLDQVLDYYRRQEPSSPVPLLVARAKKLVPMSFVEALKELAPAGMKELQAAAGALDEPQAAKKG
ncbi:MAG: type VI secretion system ImpA family N-terminal domain-containing protein [Geminicoccaceae bacterium]|nr:type VI secretion system ImpA family N-terminal domain-containing protein [Geminicoccaceae bacterium]